MTRRLPAAIAVTWLVFSFSAPLDAANREHQLMMADIRMLQEQSQQLQLLLGSVGEALKQLNARLDDQNNTSRKAFADQKLLVDTLTNEVRVVREKIDETNVRVTTLGQEVEAMRLAIPPMSAAPPTAPSTGQTETPGAPSTPTDPSSAAPSTPPASPVLGMSPQRMFDTAKSDYSMGQYSLAVQGFEQYIRTFPKSELADDAQYYIGQTYYNDTKYREAIAAYDQVIQRYPSSNFVADAYYKRGMAFANLRQLDQARQSLEFAIKNYPESPAAGLAKQALDTLNRPAR